MEGIIQAIRAIRKERIQRASWVECWKMARAFKEANEPPIGNIYGFLEYLIHQEIMLLDANRRRRRREQRLNMRLQEGEPMDLDEWEEDTSSGVGDDASTSDVESDGEDVETEDDDAVMEGEVIVEDEGPAPDYPESESDGEDEVEVIVEDEGWDNEEDGRYDPLTPPPEEMWELED